MNTFARFLAMFAAILCLHVGLPAAAQQKVLDDFASPDAWRIQLPEGVKLTLHADEGMKNADGKTGKSLRLDYEFVTGGGYCVIARDMPMELPENYEFAFHVRGQGPDNNLEFKLVDQHDKAVGESVWWVNRRAFAWPSEWTRMSNKKRKFEFAWGPSGGAPLKAISRVEFAVASSSGGRGSVWLDELTFRELPVPQVGMEGEAKAVEVTASSEVQPAHSANRAIDGDLSTSWQSRSETASLLFDFGSVREFGAVDIKFGDGHLGTDLKVESSDDQQSWTVLAQQQGWPIRVQGEAHGRQLAITPDAEARFVRLTFSRPWMSDGDDSTVLNSVAEVRFRDAAFSATPNNVVMEIAKELPRGRYPKQFLNEATYWTVIGTPGCGAEALINEEGQVEVGKRMYSIEPFLQFSTDGPVATWATAQHTQSINESGATVVTRTFEGAALEVVARAVDFAGTSWLSLTYTTKLDEPLREPASLQLAVRPYQVNPPWQRLNFEGGIANITKLTNLGPMYERSLLQVVSVTTAQGFRPVYVSVPQSKKDFGMLMLSEHNPTVPFPADSLVGLQSHVISVPLTTPESKCQVWIPLDRSVDWLPTEMTNGYFDSPGNWPSVDHNVELTCPTFDSWLSETFRAQLAYILINRDGPAIQPGSRSYERSWARDGSLTSAALMELGHQDEVRAWIDWFGDHIFENGKVPCVVDKRGADPVPEHDSHGQYIWAVANYYRYTKDKEFLTKHWPKVQHVVEYIQSLRAQRKTAEYAQAPEGDIKRAMYGLVPESISHEGYSAKPMHSYWDCFFVALGLKEATYLAREAGDAVKSVAYEAEYNDFQKCLLSSITLTQQKHGINYIPGCVELGDFDSTSTTISLFPCDEVVSTPRGSLEATFERYWQFFKDRRDGTGQFAEKPWEAYTPYELRHVGAFVRLGWRERAYELLQWFRLHQRPQGWHHWAEVVWNDPETPRFLGDMPHTWCGSDFLNSVLNMFAYTQEAAGGGGTQLVCFAGVPKAWVDSGEAIELHGLRTQFGEISLRMKRDGDTVNASIEGKGDAMPPGGLLLKKPEGVMGEDIVARELPFSASWKTVQ